MATDSAFYFDKITASKFHNMSEIGRTDAVLGAFLAGRGVAFLDRVGAGLGKKYEYLFHKNYQPFQSLFTAQNLHVHVENRARLISLLAGAGAYVDPRCLHSATRGCLGDEASVRALLDVGVPVDFHANEQRALHLAARNLREDLVNVLLKHGASPHKLNADWRSPLQEVFERVCGDKAECYGEDPQRDDKAATLIRTLRRHGAVNDVPAELVARAPASVAAALVD